MFTEFNSQALKKAGITLFLVVLIFLPHNSWLDNVAENYTEQGIKRTLVTYAVSRSLNGIISVVQGTEVAVSPAGIGVTFTPGQILDPVNDLIERFSQIVLISSVSLGVQRLFLEITSTPLISWLLSMLSALWVVLIWTYKKPGQESLDYLKIAQKTFVILIFIRFSIPLIAVSAEGLYLTFLQPGYEQSQAMLEQASDEIKIINHSAHTRGIDSPGQKSLLDKVDHWLNKAHQSLDIEKQIDALKQSGAEISQQVINMIVVFVVQTIIFPLLFLWLMFRAGRSLNRGHWVPGLHTRKQAST